MTILVIGYGNPSRMDDGVGWYVIDQLHRRWGLPPLELLSEPAADGSDTCRLGPHSVRCVWLQQLDLDTADLVAAADRLLLVDAHLDGEEIAVIEVEPRPVLGPVTHVVTPAALLALAEATYGRAPRTTLYTARGERFDFAAGLSPEVQTRADALVRAVLDEVEAPVCTS
ncbi:MAG: hydrogenase maturation protease [Armatimonadetes bacterium]|nr:hydrogenase maturation protease [Armatimonadota bacterium]